MPPGLPLLPFPPMPAPARVLRAAALVCGVLVPARSAAQGSPYVPLDDPRLPLLEHLIARGDVADPSPQVRPFRWADAARVLAAADTADAPASDLIRSLREAFEVPAGDRWRLAARGGAQPRRVLSLCRSSDQLSDGWLLLKMSVACQPA